jgi:hypothetical protein
MIDASPEVAALEKEASYWCAILWASMLDRAETDTPRRSSVGSGVSGMLAIVVRQ